MCRSPLLEQMFSDYAKKNGIDVDCSSAGLLDHEKPMSENSVKVLEEKGIRARAHVSKLINAELVCDSDYIITMTDKLKDKVIEHFDLNGETAAKTYSVSCGELLGEEVADPYGTDLTVYRAVGEQFDRLLPRLAALVLKEKA